MHKLIISLVFTIIISFNGTAEAGSTYDMRNYWPQPTYNQYLIKEYKVEHDKTVLFHQRYYKDKTDGNYRLQDFYYNYPTKNVWTYFSQWHYKIDNNRGVIEYADDVYMWYNEDTQKMESVSMFPRFQEGRELLWGNKMKVGQEVQGQLYNLSTNSWGHIWIKLMDAYPTYKVNGITYKNVIKLMNSQTFCQNTDCTQRYTSTGIYWMAPGIGFVQVEYTDKQGQRKKTAEGVEWVHGLSLTNYCYEKTDKYHCEKKSGTTTKTVTQPTKITTNVSAPKPTNSWEPKIITGPSTVNRGPYNPLNNSKR